MDNNQIIKYDNGQLIKVGNAIAVTSKLLALAEPQLIPYRKKINGDFVHLIKRLLLIVFMMKYIDSEKKLR
jgi:hypothetical protein